MPLPAVDSQRLAHALDRNEALGSLLGRVRESQQRLACVAVLLPPGLRSATRAGPLDDTGWLLLADNNATAAKLRQLLPLLTRALQDAGFAERLLRVRVQARGAAA